MPERQDELSPLRNMVSAAVLHLALLLGGQGRLLVELQISTKMQRREDDYNPGCKL